MPIMICSWLKGNTRVYTKKIDVVKKAMNDGYFVNVLKEKPHIFKNTKN
jgi:hypothetical protein